jgi:hypothetical protein
MNESQVLTALWTAAFLLDHVHLIGMLDSQVVVNLLSEFGK